MSAFLNLPAAEIPTSAMPDMLTQRHIMAMAVDDAINAVHQLPDFFATEDTIHFEDTPAGSGIDSSLIPYQPLHAVGKLINTVLYRSGHEMIEPAAKTQPKRVSLTRGLSTQGEFGTILGTVLVDAAHGKLDWSHWEHDTAGPIAVFQYAIPLKKSHYQVELCCITGANGNGIFETYSAYHGEIAVDPASGTIRRLTMEAGMKVWTERHAEWLRQVRYTHPAQQATLLDCLHEVQHRDERVKRLEKSIVEVIQEAPAPMREVVRGLQALRGIAHISAVTIAVELGNITSRFEQARDLMGYSGAFPSEDSSGKRIRRGGITKSGNAHLRRIVVESAWSYRHRPAIGARLRRRQEGLPAEITEIAWKAQNRLHKRYMTLTARGKEQRETVTAIARELLGFIWAIGIKAEAACKQQMAA
jgi:hypothetical protein